MATESQLRAALDNAISVDPSVVDLEGLMFIDASRLRVVLVGLSDVASLEVREGATRG